MNGWLRLAALLAALIVCVTAPRPLSAAPGGGKGAVVGVGLMPLDTPADDAAVGRQILAAVRDAVATTPGFTEKGPVEMRLDEARMSFSCFDEKPGCMSQVGALVDAKVLFWGKLFHDGTTLRLEAHVVDVARATSKDETFTESGAGAVDRLGRRASEFVVGKRAEPGGPVSLRSEPMGALVEVDGVAKGRTPLELVVPPGVHTVVLSLDGHQSRRRSIEVVDANPQPVNIDETLPPERTAAPFGEDVSDRAHPDAGGDRTRFWLGVSTAGLAAAGLASATIFGLKAVSLADDLDKELAAGSHGLTQSDYDDRRSEFSRAKILSNVSLGVAAASLGASLYFFLTQEDAPERDTGLRLSPTDQGLVLGGAF